MNVFHKVTLQSLRKNRTRTGVTIIGVALSAAMITAVATFGVSLLNYLVNGAVYKYGGWHVAFFDAAEPFVQECMEDEKVAAVARYQNLGYVEWKGIQAEEMPSLFIAGFDRTTFDTLPVYLLAGRMPENDREIIIPGGMLTGGDINLEPGDTLSLSTGDYTVTGICRTPDFVDSSTHGYMLITQNQEAMDGNSYGLFVTLKNPYELHDFLKNHTGGQEYVLNDRVLRFLGLSENRVFNILLGSTGAIVILIIMTGSVFLIYNAFQISINERMHQMGILASVGATERQLKDSVIFEGLCIGAAGIPIGVMAGILSMGVVLKAVSEQFQSIIYDEVSLSLKVSIPVIAAAILVSMLTILISACIPAGKAARTPVMECIRQTNEIRIEAKDVKTAGFMSHFFGMEEMLAMKSFKRNRRRYRSIILSLILSIILFVSANSFVMYLQRSSRGMTELTTYDICLTVKGMEDSAMELLYDRLKTTKDVSESGYQCTMQYTCHVNKKLLTEKFCSLCNQENLKDEKGDTIPIEVTLQFLDDATYRRMAREQKMTGDEGSFLAVAQMNGTAWEPCTDNDLFKASEMSLALSPEINVDMSLKHMVPPDSLPVLKHVETKPYMLQIMIPYSRKESFEELGGEALVKGITFCSTNPAKATEQMKEILVSEGLASSCTLYNMKEMLDEISNMIFIVNVFAYTFIIMISLIAIANVFNTISTNIKLRKRELAMLRSVGMSESAFQKMMNFECVFYGFRALLFGLPIALAASILIYRGMVIAGSEDLTFVFPFGSMGISIFGVLFVVFITMLYSVNKIKKENIIDALRDDLM